jgi:hypothetical protein
LTPIIRAQAGAIKVQEAGALSRQRAAERGHLAQEAASAGQAFSYHQADENGGQEQHQEDPEQDLGDARRGARDVSEAEERGNKRYDQEDDGPFQHRDFAFTATC